MDSPGADGVKKSLFRLLNSGYDRKDFNSYSNEEIMVRETFANVRLVNKVLNGEVGPTGEKLSVFDFASKYKAAEQDTCISGSSREWAAKGPMLVGVIAKTSPRKLTLPKSNRRR